MFKTMLIGALLAVAAASSAQPVEDVPEENSEAPPAPIATDRPTDSASPVLVPTGAFQFELGYKFSRIDANSGRTDARLFPDLLARYGVSDSFELRFVAQGWEFQDTEAGKSDGFSDISLGAKIALADEQGSRPQMSLLVDVSLPVGSTEFTSDYVIPKVLFLGENGLTDSLDLTYNIGPSLVTAKRQGQRERNIDWNYALALSGPVSESVTLFGEFFGAFADSGLPDRHNFQVGTTILLSPLFQIDIRGGIGLVNEEPDWLVGVGLAFRVPQ